MQDGDDDDDDGNERRAAVVTGVRLFRTRASPSKSGRLLNAKLGFDGCHVLRTIGR